MKKDHPSDCKQSSGISCWLMCVMFLILLLCFVSPYSLQTKHDSSTSTMCMLHFHVSIGDTNAIRSELVLPITDVGTYITVENLIIFTVIMYGISTAVAIRHRG